MTNHPTGATNDGDGYFLPPDDPNYRQWAAAVQVEPDRRVHQLSAALIANCPRAVRGDPVKCADYLSGANTAAVITTAVASSEEATIAPIARAEAAKDELIGANRDLEAINVARAELPDTAVDGPHGRRVTPAENRAQLAETQWIAHQRLVGNDDEHTKSAHTPLSGHIAAVVIALLETSFTLRVFNVSLTDLAWTTFLPWFAATVGLAVFNLKVAAYLGWRRRLARETERSAVELNRRDLADALGRGAR